MKHKITITEQCPRCHSDRTGKIIYYTGKSPVKLKKDALERGELIQIDPFGMGDTCFCMDCGAAWYGSSRTAWVTDEEIKKRKEYLQAKYPILNEQNQQNAASASAGKKEKKKKKKSGRVFAVFSFLSHCFLVYLKLFIFDSTIGVIRDAVPKKDKKEGEETTENSGE